MSRVIVMKDVTELKKTYSGQKRDDKANKPVKDDYRSGMESSGRDFDLTAYNPDKEDDLLYNRLYGFPVGAPLAFDGLSPVGGCGSAGYSFMPARPLPFASLPPSAYGGSPATVPVSYSGQGLDALLPSGGSYGAGSGRRSISIQYAASDGTVYTLSAGYRAVDHASVVDSLMRYATALIKGDAMKGSSGDYSAKGSKGR